MNKDFLRILDCFNCADGGVEFIHLKNLVETDNKNINEVLRKMVILIDISTGKIK